MIVEASIPFLALYSAGAALFRVMGNSGTSMWVSTAMNAINVVGNGLLIFVFHRGVEGVAIPTLVSRIFAAAAMLVLLRRLNLPIQVERFTFRHDRFVVKNILHFGVPNGIEGSMFQLGKILLLSTVVGAGHRLRGGQRHRQYPGLLPGGAGTALGLAIVTVVSRCAGASEYDRARYYTKKMMRTAYLYTVLVIALILACLPLILKLYNVSDQAREWATQILWMHGLCGILIWPLAFTLPQALRAAGDTRFTMVASTVSMWTLRVGLGVLLGRYWGFGVLGIWMAMFADWALRAALFVPRFHGHKWETMGLEN